MNEHASDEPVVVLERTYDADPELVWSAWTDPAILRRWYGCQPDQLWRIHEWDPRPGGRLHVSMNFDGEAAGSRPDDESQAAYHVHGEFLRVEPPGRLVYTFGEGQRVDVSIREGAGSPEESTGASPRTTVTVRHFGTPPDGPTPEEMTVILGAGWTSSLAQLVHHLDAAATRRLVLSYWRSWQGDDPDWTAMRAALADELDTAGGPVAADDLVSMARSGTPWRDVELVDIVATAGSAALLYRGVDTATDQPVEVAEFLAVTDGRISRLRGILPFD